MSAPDLSGGVDQPGDQPGDQSRERPRKRETKDQPGRKWRTSQLSLDLIITGALSCPSMS